MGRKTNFYVEYEMFDVSAAADATPSASDNQSFAHVSDLSNGTTYDASQATMEHNFFVLNGSMSEFADTQNIAYFNNTLSGADGSFSTNPKVTIQFTANHSSVGLTLHFADNYPLECKVSWYRISGELLYSETFNITSLDPVLWRPVENYGKIIIEFTKVLPYHYVKLTHVEYGQMYGWDQTSITAGTLLEQVDMISNQLSINTLSITFTDLLDLMNLGNDEGIHSYIQTKQVMRPYEYINGVKTFLGKYFIKSFTVDKSKAKLSCIDYIGILDMITFYKGDVYDGVKAGLVIDAIMEQAGITDYTVDAETYDTLIYGTIKPQTCRKALREVVFATQSMVDTSRSDSVVIYKMSKVIKNYVERSQKFSTAITKKDYVSGIKITYSEYSLGTSISKVTSGSYASGEHLITFNSPETALSLDVAAAVGEIMESGKYYCILLMHQDADITISGTAYTSKSFSNTVNVNRMDAGELEYIKSYTTTMANSALAISIAASVLQYYQNRLQLKVKYIADAERVQDWNIVRNPSSEYNDFIAGFESISTDLVGGFISTAQLVGYYNYMNNYIYAGEGMYASDNTII